MGGPFYVISGFSYGGRIKEKMELGISSLCSGLVGFS